jgi:glutamate N-acetyltransferase/amino-acid N-acetyltransferase
MERISLGIAQVARRLGQDEACLTAAARGMMTTDTHHKLASRTLSLGARHGRITGMAKGAAMIAPHMATMLAVLLTDFPLAVTDAQAALQDAVQESFNCIRVDGHTSTNDTVLLLASGATGGPCLAGSELAQFRQGLLEVCLDLARAIPADGEGASHLVEINVTGCRNRPDARRVAQAIADSPLVKTAVAGADPNWGRIVSAAGYAGVSFDPASVRLTLNGFELFRQGTPVPFDAALVSQSLRDQRDTCIQLDLGQGSAAIRLWTCDLTAEYVRLNADYHT